MSASPEQMFAPFEAKMRKEHLSDAAVASFKNSYMALVSGASGVIAESDIKPAEGLPHLEKDLKPKIKVNPELLKETVVLKLNGGLGTGMGLDKAKSLLPVKAKDTFLDLTAKQVMAFRHKFKSHVRFILMNSFSTSEDTLSYLSKYPALVADPNLELLQNKVPKVDAASLEPVAWPTNPAQEWCPPGHGDLYAALDGSGTLDRLLADGVKYMFVSNSDNLGATLDLSLLTYFAESGSSFMMECAERTEADKKGGHLAVRSSDGQLILRESAQCAKEDEPAFQDVSRHKYFNTNNLWVRLDKLKEATIAAGGLIPLPMIKNGKTVDPKDGKSPKVWQLETAMGAAIECFPGSSAVVVPRTRFVPVKKCNDLLLLRSDTYVLTADGTPALDPSRRGAAPLINLDDKAYKLVQQLEAATQGGTPSLVGADRLTIQGQVWLSSGVVFQGTTTVTNKGDEPKVLPKGVYKDASVDLTAAPGLGALRPTIVATAPIPGQKPGTSGLRKKVVEFQSPHYLNNFVQAVFNALVDFGTDVTLGGSLVVGGDGRYFNPEAIQIITKMAVANGVKRILIAKDGLLSTPAASAVIRERGPAWQKAFGAFILSASHNPGGPSEDFGIKYNIENGGPAPEKVTNAMYSYTTTLTSYKIAPDFPDVDTSKLGSTRVVSADGSRGVVVTVFDGLEEHVKLLKTIFDFEAIQTLMQRPDFSFVYDSMSGVQGPYAHKVFVEELGAATTCLLNAEPKDDFGGGHADPNLTYAHDLIHVMGVDSKGNAVAAKEGVLIPSFGAAADGDADRNMILGRQFFVTPSDSLAIIVAHADVIPFFRDQGGLRGVARSMPTSGAVDLVAKRMNMSLFETPTGWKFFGNLMDSREMGGANYTPFICGEESFGTGSDHVREKDGMWAVLAWLSILAHYNQDPKKALVSVESIVREHWRTYGRNYYVRYDYEGVDKSRAEAMVGHMTSSFAAVTGQCLAGGYTVAVADEFQYVDPVDGSVSSHQGVRYLFTDGSRVIFRLSGTAGSGATVRMYLEKYEADRSKLGSHPLEALGVLVQVALELSDLEKFTGRKEPTVIT
ncbi:phosphoglucomutase [Nannochloropsis gaditana]|uniref:Phosphoglucomutase n=1 Tax=Nannochloropsis gaditana TaxID=72520 RepID=W7T5H8_9STRA|nr:phosphoglucomutase [Nannochloropsis gaditana]